MEAIANTFQAVASRGEASNFNFSEDQRQVVRELIDIKLVSSQMSSEDLPEKDLDSRRSMRTLADITTLFTETYTNNRGNQEAEEVDQRKDEKELDIPAKGGLKDESWEINMGGEIIKILKPKDPLADLREMMKNAEMESPEKEKKKAHKAMKENFIKKG